jgi:hypothetical protein
MSKYIFIILYRPNYPKYVNSGYKGNDFDNNFKEGGGYEEQDPSGMFGFSGKDNQHVNTKVIKLDLSLNKFEKKYHKFIGDLEILIENLTLSNVRFIY